MNAVLKKEAAYFGDIVILPFMDRYELVVLKTVAICEYGVSSILSATENCFPFNLFNSFLQWLKPASTLKYLEDIN